MERIVSIEQLGRHGEGIAHVDGDRLFVPYALAGETVRVDIVGERGRLLEVVEPAPGRIQPFCSHFGTCGGCALQHMDPAAYAGWKRDIVEIALRNRGLDAPVDTLIDAHGSGRRRATFHVVRTRRGPIIGFAAARSHQIVSIDTCPVLTPELGDALLLAHKLAEVLSGGSRSDIQFTASDSGVDVHVTRTGPLDLDMRQKLAEIAEAAGLARIAIDGEPIVERRPPHIRVGEAVVAFPPGSFLQATQAGEQALADLVCAHVGDARRVADLFSGVGPFAVRAQSPPWTGRPGRRERCGRSRPKRGISSFGRCRRASLPPSMRSFSIRPGRERRARRAHSRLRAFLASRP